MKTIPETIVALISLLEQGRERTNDLRGEGPTIWPLLLEAAGGDSMAGTATFHTLDRLNVGRGRDFLPWSRDHSSREIICALGSALGELCECGAILPDPEDSSLCGECQADAQIHNQELKTQEGRRFVG